MNKCRKSGPPGSDGELRTGNACRDRYPGRGCALSWDDLLRAVGTGVVASRSYEAKARGVATAMPLYEALRRCPDLVVRAGDARLCERYRQRVAETLRLFAPVVEVCSPTCSSWCTYQKCLKPLNFRFSVSIPVGGPDPENLPATVFQDLLADAVSISCDGVGMVGGSIAFDTAEILARLIGMNHTDVD